MQDHSTKLLEKAIKKLSEAFDMVLLVFFFIYIFSWALLNNGTGKQSTREHVIV